MDLEAEWGEAGGQALSVGRISSGQASVGTQQLGDGWEEEEHLGRLSASEEVPAQPAC